MGTDVQGGPEMPRLTDDEVVAFLDEPGHLVRIGTVDADGFPQHRQALRSRRRRRRLRPGSLTTIDYEEAV
jgi:hypothetical protein